MAFDILVITAHPDDAELGCGGTIMSHISQGYSVALAELTQGERGTRGNATLRLQEAAAAAQIMGVTQRENLAFPDAFFDYSDQYMLPLIGLIRRLQPKIVITNATHDRHPDHEKAARLVEKACFLSGLKKIETKDQFELQQPFRPYQLFFMIQDRLMVPNFTIDISPFWDKKLEAIAAFKSQFYDPEYDGTDSQTYISRPIFHRLIEARALELGHAMGYEYAEGFISARPYGIKSLFNIE